MFTSENARDMQARRKTRTGGKQGSITSHLPASSGSDISSILADLRYWDGVTKVTSDEDCIIRLQDFFMHCEEEGSLPTVEKMAIALGITRKTLCAWENGELGEDRAEIIGIAKERIHALEGDLVMKGKIPAVPYIFRSKNYYGMVDKQEVHMEAEVEETIEEKPIDKEALALTYIKSVPVISSKTIDAIEERHGGKDE